MLKITTHLLRSKTTKGKTTDIRTTRLTWPHVSLHASKRPCRASTNTDAALPRRPVTSRSQARGSNQARGAAALGSGNASPPTIRGPSQARDSALVRWRHATRRRLESRAAPAGPPAAQPAPPPQAVRPTASNAMPTPALTLRPEAAKANKTTLGSFKDMIQARAGNRHVSWSLNGLPSCVSRILRPPGRDGRVRHRPCRQQHADDA